MGFLQGKKLLMTGVLSERSIAYGVAEACKREGAELAFTYVNEKVRGRVETLAKHFESEMVYPFDVQVESQFDDLRDALSAKWGALDGFLHAIAFAPREALMGNFLDGFSKEAFFVSQEVSAYSFPAMVKALRPLMAEKGGSCVTLTYEGAQRVLPHYNIMGLAKASLEASVRYSAVAVGQEQIRCNAISSGPIRTLAASGIQDFRKIFDHNAGQSALQRNVTIEEIGNFAAFLLSDLSSCITGQVLHADCGYSITSMNVRAEEEKAAQ